MTTRRNIKQAEKLLKEAKRLEKKNQIPQAILKLRKAQDLVPEHDVVCFHLARLLSEQQAFEEAEKLFLPLLSALRNESRQVQNGKNHFTPAVSILQNPKPFIAQAQPLAQQKNFTAVLNNRTNLAATLNNLANLYAGTQRPNEAEQYYQEALTIRRDLAKYNPQAYQKEVATTLNNLANLYADTQRQKEAENCYAQATDIYRKLAETNPDAHNIDLARILFNQGRLYADYPEKAKVYFDEAVQVLEHFKDRAQSIPVISEFLKNIAKEQDKQKKLYRAKLEEKNRQEYLGMMASATMHQINQPIGSIRALVDAARADLKEDLFSEDDLVPLLENIWKQSERLKNIINSFQHFSGGDRVPTAATDINQVLKETLSLFEAQFKQRNINLKLQLITKPLWVWLNPFQLQEALLNLLTNARDALEGRTDAEISISTGQDLAEQLFLRIEDNGPGVAENFTEQLFTPFSTTKATGKGTGMGLYISRKIITEAEGELSYHHRDNGGACFEIRLPHYQATTQE
ncbi:sensor histidine kinase [Candidatus Venteria ishoeyi]|uniref:histidine kinase n=1 Tax=Candidatus Venteria ishoeyi TaxID=1899563 RepID=A0A1H6FDU0_9GAMM|nr:ATP-binding protein [Candidatus Venteria ishoeyi]SEH07489.1 C4-dicarboxylate transport sensor protein DctB [Candidatus Venteria ishoeyi]